MTRQRVVTAILAVATVVTASCSNLPRSRDLGNPAVAGQTLAEQVCSNCHGVTGMSVSPNAPNLAGQQREYLVGQLKEFRGHDRRDPAGFEYMWGIARSLSDRQVDDLAAYFSAQTATSQPFEGDTAAAATGSTIFAQGIAAQGVPPCGSCHGPDGLGNGAFPRLAGQHADYLVKQLTVFQRTDERPNGAVMQTVAHKLTTADILNVAAYIQTLPRPATR